VRNYKSCLPDRFPLVHPSPRNQIWMKRNPWFEAEVLPDLKRAVADALG
jgi:uracil-DNA glycosylase